MTMQAERSSSSSQQQVDVEVRALDAKSIRSIQLATGWEPTQGDRFTQFAVGTAHSPITPSKMYPALIYTNQDGKEVVTPLSQVLSFSTEKINS